MLQKGHVWYHVCDRYINHAVRPKGALLVNHICLHWNICMATLMKCEVLDPLLSHVSSYLLALEPQTLLNELINI